MDENQGTGGSADIGASGADQNKKDMVAHQTYLKALSQEKAAKERAKLAEEKNLELASKLSELESAQKLRDENKLAEKGDYQKILELREKEINELKTKYENTNNEKESAHKALIDAWKLQAFNDKLSGKIKRKEYYNFVDLDAIAVNPETREIDEQSLQGAVSKFVENYSDLIDSKSFPKLPSNSAFGNSMNSPDNFKNLSLKDMKKALPMMVKAERTKKGL